MAAMTERDGIACVAICTIWIIALCSALAAEHRDDALRLCGNDIGSLRPLLALLDVELDRLALMQSIVLPVAGAVMEKDIGRSRDGNKAEPFLGFLLNGSCGHEKRGKEKYDRSVHRFPSESHRISVGS